MAWIGGIFSKVSLSQSDIREKLASMVETAYPANSPPGVPCLLSLNSISDDARGQALAQVSHSVEGTPSAHIYADHQKRLALIYDGHLYEPNSSKANLSRYHDRINETTAESLVHLLAELPGTLEQKVRQVLTGVDGDYALAVSDSGQILISRDSVGTRPLYFAENNEFCAFASNKKPLWKIGLGEVRPIRAGTIAIFNGESVSIKKAACHPKKEVDIKDMAQAVGAYEEALSTAISKRIAEMQYSSKAGILLSGGVDSCLMAKLVRDAAGTSGIETIAYTAGLPNSPDVNFAREFARELGIRHQVKMLSVNEVEQYIPRVVEAIEDSDFVQVETGIGLYAAIEMASQDGTRVIFSGQGPDELWGGYNWYPKVLGRDSRQKLCRRMQDDFTRVGIETLDRENKIAMAHGVELFFPYLDTGVVNVGMSVASELKVTSEKDSLGKHPHRRVAIKMGIPERYANREKLAIQHGTGIHALLDDIARRNGFDPALVKHIGYRNEDITTAKMGSSARYGYRYVEKKLWQVPQHVQLFLHAIAYSRGLLNESTRNRIAYFLKKARLSSELQSNA